MNIQIPPWPYYEADEIEAVQLVLESGKGNYWVGEEGKLFEQEFAHWCGMKHGLCISNGTVAIELALRACGIKRGDEVVVTPRSFLASVAAVVAIGATPVFADVDECSGNITAATVKRVVTNKTKGIVPVHLGGWPADMPSIMELANQHDIKVIEDCAQAHGATINNQSIGSFGHAAAFSFCQDKIMSTGGEGGMILTNDDEVRDIAWSLRDHGRNRSKSLSNNHPFGFRWLQERFGTNGRMTEMQSAIGRRQLHKVDNWVKERNENAKAFAEFFDAIDGVTIHTPKEHLFHSYYRFTAVFEDDKRRDSVVEKLQSHNVPATVGPCPEIYLEEVFCGLNAKPIQQLSIAHELGKRSMVLPVHPGMNKVLPEIINKISTLLT